MSSLLSPTVPKSSHIRAGKGDVVHGRSLWSRDLSGRISSAPPTCGTDVLGQSKLDVYPSQHENMKTGCSKWPRPHLPRPIITPSLMIFKCVYISHLRVSIGVRTDGEIGPLWIPSFSIPQVWKPQQLSQEVLELVNLHGGVTERRFTPPPGFNISTK